MKPPPGQVGIVLQGGGALGACRTDPLRSALAPLLHSELLTAGPTRPTPGAVDALHVVHPVAPRQDGVGPTQDIDSKPAGVRAQREAGLADTCGMGPRAPWRATVDPIEGSVGYR